MSCRLACTYGYPDCSFDRAIWRFRCSGGILEGDWYGHWIDLNIDGHNTSVMSVRGAGLRNNNNSAEFGAIDEAAAMWTSSSTSDGKV